MEEGENIAQYASRIKEAVSVIRSYVGHLEDETILCKVLRTFLLIYAIRVLFIQDLRCVLGNKLSLEGIVGRLVAFELSNFDNYKTESLESTFKENFLLKDSNEKKQSKKRRIKNVSSDSDTEEDDVE